MATVNISGARTPMRLSVVIPCFNGAATLPDQLEALANQSWPEPWEVVLADNGSTDDTMEIVRAYQNRMSNLRVVDASRRRGQPYALNIGAQAARSENLSFIDADDVVGEGYVRGMANALARHDFVACRLDLQKLNPKWLIPRTPPQSTGIQKYYYPPYLPHAGGGTIGVKRALFDMVGGFDETLPCLHDTDFCWKLELAGIQLQFIPEAVVHVRLRHSLRAIYRQARSWGVYNVIIYQRYLAHGMPRLSPKAGLRAWWKLVEKLIQYPGMDQTSKAEFIWHLAWRIGRLEASVKNWVFAL
jgi:glycosyltransferase involved in cell wall biosynthesis